MATETNLTKVNVFPDEVSYEQNKSSLGSGELSLIPLPDSSVPSETDLEKGYITFDNGLILQWGKYVGETSLSTSVVSFLLPFPNECISVQVNYPVAYGGRVDLVYATAWDITNTNFKLQTYTAGSEHDWIAIGR